MSPIREYLCNYCGHQFEEVQWTIVPEEYETTECRCGSRAKVLPALIGGYFGNTGGSSTRPKNSTSMPKKKAYTKAPETYDEPTKEQLEQEKAKK